MFVKKTDGLFHPCAAYIGRREGRYDAQTTLSGGACVADGGGRGAAAALAVCGVAEYADRRAHASPWEWGKALYWPVLAALLLLRWMAADETEHPVGRAWWLAAALPLVMTGACWALGAAGESILWIWLAVLTLGLPAGLLPRGRGSALLPLTLAVLLGAAYLLFTVLPPLGGPFTDPADVSALAPIPY